MLAKDQQREQFGNHASKLLPLLQQPKYLEDIQSDDEYDDIDADDEDEDNAHQVLNMLSHNKEPYGNHKPQHHNQIQNHSRIQFPLHPRDQFTSPKMSAPSQMVSMKMKSSSTSQIPQISPQHLMMNKKPNHMQDPISSSHPSLNDISHLISSHPDDAAEAPSISSPSSEDMSEDDMPSPPQHQNFSSLSLHSPKPKFNLTPGMHSGGMMKSSSCSNIVPKTCNYNKCCICAYGPPPSFFTSAPTWADICYIALYCLTLSKQDIKYFHIKKDICTFIDSHYETMCMRKRTSIWRQTVNMTLSHPQYFEMFQQESALENGRKGYYGLKQVHDPYEHTALNKRSRRKRRHEQKMIQEELKKSNSFSNPIPSPSISVRAQSPINMMGSMFSPQQSPMLSQQSQHSHSSQQPSQSQSSSPSTFNSNDNDFIPAYELASISQQYKRAKCYGSSSTPQTPSSQSQIPSPSPAIASGKPPLQSPQFQHQHQNQHHHQNLHQHQHQAQLHQQSQKKNLDSLLNPDEEMTNINNNSNKRSLSSPIEKPQMNWFRPLQSSVNQDNDIVMSNSSNSAQNTPSPIVKRMTQKTILPKLDDEEEEIIENEREVPRLYNKSPMSKLILEKNLPPPTSITQNPATQSNSNPNSNSNSPSSPNSRSNSPLQQTPSPVSSGSSFPWLNNQMQPLDDDDDDNFDDDDDEDSPKKRMRKTTRPDEKQLLEKYYQLHYGSNAKHCKEELQNLSDTLVWKVNRIQRWLDNRRTKDKLKTLRASQERNFIYAGQQYSYQNHYNSGQNAPIPVVPNTTSKDRTTSPTLFQQSPISPQSNTPYHHNKLLQHSPSSSSINSLLN